jgi:MFS family permease
VIRRVFKAFQYRDYRVMWIGACASSIGTWMQKLAQSWLVYDISHSAPLLGLDAFLGDIPIFLFSLVGGAIADRMDRRRLLIGSQCLQMASALTLTLLVTFGVTQVWHILCLSFITGLAQAFGGPAYQALIPTLVEKEDMPNAIALQSIQFNVARVVGPAIGGIALVNLGAKWCFGLNALSFVAPIVSLLMVKPRFVPGKPSASIVASMKEGFGFIRRQGSMEALMVLAFCMTALGVPMLTFLPVFAKDVFAGGTTAEQATRLTLFFSFSGAGSIAGALAMAWLGNMQHKGRAALGMLIAVGVAIAGFGWSRWFPLSCLMLFLSGASLMGVFATVNSLVQLITTNEMRGRVMSAYNFAFRGGMPLGNLICGQLVPLWTAPVVIGFNGVLLAVLGIYYFVAQRRVAAL